MDENPCQTLGCEEHHAEAVGLVWFFELTLQLMIIIIIYIYSGMIYDASHPQTRAVA